MLFRDRPLLVDGVDRRLYVERPKLERAVEGPLLSGGNVLVLGEPGSGKSTLLRRVAVRLREAGRSVAVVNAAPADDALSLLELVDAALGGTSGGTALTQHAPGTAGALLGAARALRRAEEVTIVVDGLMDPQIGYDVFGRLRDELWDARHSWLVAVRPRDSGPLRTPPADAFWTSVVEIPPLHAGEIAAMLELGLEPEEYVRLDDAGPLSDLYPREVIREAQMRLSEGGREAGVRIRALEDIAAGLGSSESMAMSELLGLGRPVSAHDPDLLDRLGWSRAYAQRILSRLESAGLVRTVPERDATRSGRPRKLYEPAGQELR